jgi:hypothetical protein
MPKREEHSAEELVNDPSLRWADYRLWELLHSDAHDGLVRFLEYTGKGRAKVRVANLNGITPYKRLAKRLQVRRP